jgi:hypothetical protein
MMPRMMKPKQAAILMADKTNSTGQVSIGIQKVGGCLTLSITTYTKDLDNGESDEENSNPNSLAVVSLFPENI